MQMLRAMRVPEASEARAETKVGLGALEQGLNKGAQVKAGSANQNGDALAALYFSDCRFSAPGEFARGEVLGWVRYVNQMMRDAAPVLERDFRRCYVEPAIDLDGIEVDDLTVQTEGQLDAEIAFA